MIGKNLCSKEDLIPSRHYWLKGPDEESVLVYYYNNQDAGCFGFGFNIADGGGFLPLWDLRDSSSIEGPIKLPALPICSNCNIE